MGLIGIVFCLYLLKKGRKLLLWLPTPFANNCEIILMLCDETHYALVTLKHTAGHIPKFSINAPVKAEKLKLEQHLLGDVLRIDWSETLLRHGNQFVKVPGAVTLPFWDKWKMRKLMLTDDMTPYLFIRQRQNFHKLYPQAPPVEQSTEVC